MSPTFQEAIRALKPYFNRIQETELSNIVKSLSGKFKGALRKSESSARIIRAMRDTSYGRI